MEYVGCNSKKNIMISNIGKHSTERFQILGNQERILSPEKYRKVFIRSIFETGKNVKKVKEKIDELKDNQFNEKLFNIPNEISNRNRNEVNEVKNEYENLVLTKDQNESISHHFKGTERCFNSKYYLNLNNATPMCTLYSPNYEFSKNVSPKIGIGPNEEKNESKCFYSSRKELFPVIHHTHQIQFSDFSKAIAIKSKIPIGKITGRKFKFNPIVDICEPIELPSNSSKNRRSSSIFLNYPTAKDKDYFHVNLTTQSKVPPYDKFKYKNQSPGPKFATVTSRKQFLMKKNYQSHFGPKIKDEANKILKLGHIKTVHCPDFKNYTSRYKNGQKLPSFMSNIKNRISLNSISGEMFKMNRYNSNTFLTNIDNESQTSEPKIQKSAIDILKTIWKMEPNVKKNRIKEINYPKRTKFYSGLISPRFLTNYL